VVAPPFFCLQQVDFDELDPDVQALVPPAVRYGRIYPCMLVVPMGWSWAVWLVQRKHEHIVGGVAEAFGATLVSDCSPPPVMSGDTLLMSMYIDNLLVQGANAEKGNGLPQGRVCGSTRGRSSYARGDRRGEGG
jgi:hypothetical protein